MTQSPLSQSAAGDVVARNEVSGDADKFVAFLEEAARYFSNRPTGGEDSAYWANVYNAENCQKTAALIRTLFTEMRGLEEQAATWAAQCYDEALSPSAVNALQAIADLPTGRTEEVMEGQEQAYRAVEALFATPPRIYAQGIETGTAETARLGPKDESPVPAGNAPETALSTNPMEGKQ